MADSTVRSGATPVPSVPQPIASQPIASEVLFRDHAHFVVSFLRHMGVAEADLDDALQDVFLVAHRKGGYRPGAAAPRTWLASLSIRVASARRRAKRRRPVSAPLHEGFADDRSDPARHVDDRQALKRVQAALGHLSDNHRAVFILHEIEGVSGHELAGMWDVPVGTIYTRLHHARKRFKKAYRAVCNRQTLSNVGGR
ncbi:MAG: RNA polymerase sigma factor [Myxococcales bacterium]|nr:RNA polymerase sigma factor [Myxococcales bacterium]MDD9970041.1 RNA polymerase sigma factor [Myxococcales bacterium]